MLTVDSNLMKELNEKYDNGWFILLTHIVSTVLCFFCTTHLLDVIEIKLNIFTAVILVLPVQLALFIGVNACIKLCLSFSVWKRCKEDLSGEKWDTIFWLLNQFFMTPTFLSFYFLFVSNLINISLLTIGASLIISLISAFATSILLSVIITVVLCEIHSKNEEDEKYEQTMEPKVDRTFSFSYITPNDSFSSDITLLNEAIRVINESSITQSVENKHSIETSLLRIQTSINIFEQLSENKKTEAEESILNAIKKTKALLDEENEMYEDSLLLEIQKQCALIPEKNRQ